MLDLLEVPLKASCIQFRRLDGTMSVNDRDKAVKDFNNLPEVTVMIMSLKAGSLGLNLVAGCHVLLLDLWWNPTTEDQAIDRAHRIGQTRPVTVSRLTVRDTVEDLILALQDEKEAKKIHTMLSNRESARETVRRRQAIHGELTKRVSDLSSDDDKLKMEKELAMQGYKSLEETNQQLKEQIAKRPEVQGLTSSPAFNKRRM